MIFLNFIFLYNCLIRSCSAHCEAFNLPEIYQKIFFPNCFENIPFIHSCMPSVSTLLMFMFIELMLANVVKLALCQDLTYQYC